MSGLKDCLLLENAIESLNPKFDIDIQGLEWPVFLDKLKKPRDSIIHAWMGS